MSEAYEYNVKAKISVDSSEAEKGFQQFEERLSGVEERANQAGVSLGKLVSGQMIGNLLSKAFSTVANSMGKAISRVDTLNNYGNIMQSLGYEAEDADRSIDKLGKSIEGLPTSLDGIVSNTQQLAASLGDLDKATDLSVGLNDMLNASGKGAEAAAQAFVQYNQMVAKNKVDMQSWMSVVQTAPAQMDALAKSMLGQEANAQSLYAALQDGTFTIDDLNNAIIRLDTEGANGMASFHDQALQATDGIATNISNLKTAVTKGVANMIQNFQDAAKDNGLPTISQTLQKLKGVVNNVFSFVNKTVTKVVNATSPVLKALSKAFDYLGEHIELVMDVLGPAVAGFAAFKIASKVAGWISALNAIVAKYVATQAASTAANVAGATAETADAAATTADTVAKGANATATGLATKAQALFNAVLTANPIGLVITAVMGLVAAIKLLSDILPKVTPEQQEALDSFNELKVAADENWDAFKEGRREYKKYDTTLKNSGDTQKRIIAAEEEASKIVEARTQNEEDLTKAIENRNEMRRQWDEAVANDKSPNHVYIEGTKNQNPVYQAYQGSIEEVNRLGEQQRAIEMQAAIHQQNMAKIQADALEEEKASKEQSLTYEEWKQKQLRSLYAMERADLYNAIQTQTATYDQLSEKNQETIDRLRDQFQEYYEGASNMFDQLSNDFGESANEYVQSMQDVLTHNQTVIAQMGENMQSLRGYFENAGLDTALLDQLERMGVEGAAPIAALTTLLHDGTEESKQQLADLAASYSESMNIAATAVEDEVGKAAGDIAEKTEFLWAQEYESLQSALKGTQWSELSQACIDGIAEGFDDSAAAIEKAKELGVDLDKATKEGAGVHSPSWKYAETAAQCVLGTAQGFSHTAPAETAARNLGESVVNAVNDLPDQLYTIGAWSGEGFANGLASMAGSVMSVANSIANSVSNTISNALKVGSPSKVLEKIGMWGGKGLVNGLAGMEKAVRQAADNLIHAAGQFFAPEVPMNGNTYSIDFAGNDGGYSSLQGQIDELRDAIMKQPIIVDGTVEMDGREVGRITAPYSREAISKLNQRDAYRKGSRVAYGTI